MTGITELFASLDGYERHEAQLELWVHWHRSRSHERWAAWRARNPDRVREISQRATAKYVARHKNDPAWRIKKLAADKRHRERHKNDPMWREKKRAADRASWARKRAEARAA